MAMIAMTTKSSISVNPRRLARPAGGCDPFRMRIGFMQEGNDYEYLRIPTPSFVRGKLEVD
jgi:hypothetical protein